MANPEHAALVRQGREAIAEWRREHATENLDLREADLSGVTLSRTNLTGEPATNWGAGQAQPTPTSAAPTSAGLTSAEPTSLGPACFGPT